METPHHGSAIIAAINTLISMISATIAYITLGDVQKVSSLIATGVAIVSGCFAITYYYFVIAEKIKILKSIKKL